MRRGAPSNCRPKTLRRRSRSRRGRLQILATLAGSSVLVFVLVTGLVGESGFVGEISKGTAPGSILLEDHPTGASDGATTNSPASDCGLLDPTQSAIPEQIRENVTEIFSVLCEEAPFEALVATWGASYEYTPANGSGTVEGASNFSLSFGANSGVFESVFYTVDWTAACDNASLGSAGAACDFQEYWTGDTVNNSIAGPTLEERSPICPCGPIEHPSGVQVPVWWWVAIAALAVVATVLIRRRKRS